MARTFFETKLVCALGLLVAFCVVAQAARAQSSNKSIAIEAVNDPFLEAAKTQKEIPFFAGYNVGRGEVISNEFIHAAAGSIVGAFEFVFADGRKLAVPFDSAVGFNDTIREGVPYYAAGSLKLRMHEAVKGLSPDDSLFVLYQGQYKDIATGRNVVEAVFQGTGRYKNLVGKTVRWESYHGFGQGTCKFIFSKSPQDLPNLGHPMTRFAPVSGGVPFSFKGAYQFSEPQTVVSDRFTTRAGLMVGALQWTIQNKTFSTPFRSAAVHRDNPYVFQGTMRIQMWPEAIKGSGEIFVVFKGSEASTPFEIENVEGTIVGGTNAYTGAKGSIRWRFDDGIAYGNGTLLLK